MATIQDRWHRKNRETGKLERTALYGKGKRYRPHFRDPPGREVTKAFDRKVDAQRWLDEQTATRVLPTWERVPLAKVRHSDVAAWVASMRAEGLSASRTRQSYHLLTSMLDDAVRDNRLPRNPAAKVDLPRLKTTDRRYLTH